MGRRASYAPGTFSWVELATTGPAEARAFYADLFGWEMEDAGDGRGPGHTVCRLGGDAVCGLSGASDEQRTEAGSGWTSYVTVADAAAAAARAREAGGEVIADPAVVGDTGRVAVLRDPQGAAFAAWEPDAWAGAERVNDVGCLCMNELATTEIEAARTFYEELFGWRTETVEAGADEPPMVLAYNGESLNASLSVVEEGSTAHWRPYFTVESTERAMDRVRELGGRDLLAPTQIFDGSIAVALDPHRAVFGLFAGEVDP